MKNKDKKEKKNGKKNVLRRYNEADAKGGVKITAMKTGVDLLLGVGVGTGLGAVSGIFSPLLGFILIGVGHYFGDKSGVLRMAGASAFTYGVARAIENRASASAASVEGISFGAVTEGVKGRLVNLKDNWMHALYIDKLIGAYSTTTEKPEETSMGAIDVSVLDVFNDINRKSAINREMRRIESEGAARPIMSGGRMEDDQDDDDEDDDSAELNYTIIDDELDLV